MPRAGELVDPLLKETHAMTDTKASARPAISLRLDKEKLRNLAVRSGVQTGIVIGIKQPGGSCGLGKSCSGDV
jgi:hypothetical protein